MKKEVKLVNKVKRLLRRANLPRYLHRYGPKIYELYEHLMALLIMHYCRLSYRRIKYLFDILGIRCPSKSALHYTLRKIKSNLWNELLELTSGSRHHIVAIDSTGLSRTNPSYHYLKRIDGKMPKIPVKLSSAYDTKRKKFCAAKIRVLPAHDVKDAEYLIEKSNPDIAVADKAYNSESLYGFAYENDVILMSPAKKNAFRGYYRKKMSKLFRIRTYHRRELIESGHSSLWRKFGFTVGSRTARTIRAEVYCKLICSNLFIGLLDS